MREIFKEWLKKLEFMTGLKQFRDISPDDARLLLDCLEEKVKEYHWMTESRLNDIMKKGMEGGFVYVDPKGVRYGEFYSINVKTITQWCSTYYENHKQLFMIENFPRSEEEEVSQEEIDRRLEVGRQIFRDCWEKAKGGEIRPLFEWIPTNYQKFIDLGLLKESDYRFDEVYESRMMRIHKGLSFTPTDLIPKRKEMIWKQFIKDMVSQKIDLPSYL